MPASNRVADEGSAGTATVTLEERKALVETLIKVVACYHHLASCVGGCTDGVGLRHELRQTREKAQSLALAGRRHLTPPLRDKDLDGEERQEMELLWVAFSSSLELLLGDMCRVCTVAKSFPLSNNNALVQTGIQGKTKEVAMRALSLAMLRDEEQVPENLASLEDEIIQVDRMIEDMELKVNVLRWTVEAQGPQYAEPASPDSASLGLLSMGDGDDSSSSQALCDRSQIFIILLLCAVAMVAAVLSACLVYFS